MITKKMRDELAKEGWHRRGGARTRLVHDSGVSVSQRASGMWSAFDAHGVEIERSPFVGPRDARAHALASNKGAA